MLRKNLQIAIGYFQVFAVYYAQDVYKGDSYYELAKKYVISKVASSLVESKNSIIRHHLTKLRAGEKRKIDLQAFKVIYNLTPTGI